MDNPEARRCLLCRNPKCSAACAVNTDVPAAMRLYREGRMAEAGQMLFANNPLSAVTSIVCDWKKTCYGHCILNAKKVPVRWHEIEEEISGKYIFSAGITPGQGNGKSVAVVGSGPAGITAAMKLREAGCEVTIYDRNPEPGGILKYGIPAFRLNHSLIDEYGRIMAEAGIRFCGGSCIGRDSMESLRKEHDAVLVATGADIPRRLDIPGEESGDVIYALDYLKDPSSFHIGGKVLVIGGGNVTIDACRTAVRAGHDTWVYYRKSFENMPANSIEVQEAIDEGVHFQLFEVPVEIRGHKAVMRNCENVTKPDGRIATRILEGSDHEVDFDTMIVAISASVDYGLIGGKPEKQLTENQDGRLPGIFHAGDFVLGPATVVEAVASAKKAADAIISHLSSGQQLP